MAKVRVIGIGVTVCLVGVVALICAAVARGQETVVHAQILTLSPTSGMQVIVKASDTRVSASLDVPAGEELSFRAIDGRLTVRTLSKNHKIIGGHFSIRTRSEDGGTTAFKKVPDKKPSVSIEVQNGLADVTFK